MGWVCRSCIDSTLLPKSKIQIFKILWRCHHLQNYFHQHSQVSVTMNAPKPLQELSPGFTNQNLWLVLYPARQIRSAFSIHLPWVKSAIKEKWSRSSLHFIHGLMNSLKKQKTKNPIITFLRAHKSRFTPSTHFKALYSKSYHLSMWVVEDV